MYFYSCFKYSLFSFQVIIMIITRYLQTSLKRMSREEVPVGWLIPYTKKSSKMTTTSDTASDEFIYSEEDSDWHSEDNRSIIFNEQINSWKSSYLPFILFVFNYLLYLFILHLLNKQIIYFSEVNRSYVYMFIIFFFTDRLPTINHQRLFNG